MVVDAIEVAFEQRLHHTFVICTGDSDFTPLVHKLRELTRSHRSRGQGATSALLPPACDEFLFYENLDGVEPSRARPGGGGEQVDDPPRAGSLITTLFGLLRSGGGRSRLLLERLLQDPSAADSLRAFGGCHPSGAGRDRDLEGRGGDPCAFPSRIGEGAAFDLLVEVVTDLSKKGTPCTVGLRPAPRGSTFSEKKFGYSGFPSLQGGAARGQIELTWDEEVATTGSPLRESHGRRDRGGGRHHRVLDCLSVARRGGEGGGRRQGKGAGRGLDRCVFVDLSLPVHPPRGGPSRLPWARGVWQLGRVHRSGPAGSGLQRVGVLWMMGESQERVGSDADKLIGEGVKAEAIGPDDVTELFPSLSTCGAPFDLTGEIEHECAPARLPLREARWVAEPVGANQDLIEATRRMGGSVEFNSRVADVLKRTAGCRGFVSRMAPRSRRIWWSTPPGRGATSSMRWLGRSCAGPHADRIQTVYRSWPPDLGPIPVGADASTGIYFRP